MFEHKEHDLDVFLLLHDVVDSRAARREASPQSCPQCYKASLPLMNGALLNQHLILDFIIAQKIWLIRFLNFENDSLEKALFVKRKNGRLETARSGSHRDGGLKDVKLYETVRRL